MVVAMSHDVDAVRKEVQRRPGGRSARVRAAVLRATLEVMAEHGAGGLTISEIARRAGVHATSVQRRWGTTENVVLDAMLTRSQEQLPVPDTGTLRGDLIAFARLVAAYLATPLGHAPDVTIEGYASGGSSNITAFLEVDGARWVLRRPPVGNLLPTAHDMVREFQFISALQGSAVPVVVSIGGVTSNTVTMAVAP